MIAPVKGFKAPLQHATTHLGSVMHGRGRLPVALKNLPAYTEETLGVSPSGAFDAFDAKLKIDQDVAALQDTATVNTFAPPNTSALMNATRMVDKYGQNAFLGWDLGLPIASNITSGAVKLMAGGAGIVGLTGGQSLLQKTSGKILAPMEYLNGHKIGDFAAGGVFAKAVDAAVTPFYALTNAFDSMTGLVSKNAVRIAGKVQKHAQAAETHAAHVLQHAPTPVSEKFAQYMAAHSFGEEKAAAEASKELNDLLAAHRVDKGIHKAVAKYTKYTAKANAAAEGAKGWENLAAGAHNTVNGVATTSLQKGVTGSLIGLTAATSGVITAHDIVTDMNAYRHLVADLTNQKVEDVTVSESLFGPVPFVAKKARAALLTNALPRGVLEGVNAVFNIQAIKAGHFSLKMMIPFLGSQMIGALTSGNVLDVYKEMKTNELSGLQHTPEQYTKLIGLASPELHERGAADSEFAQALGEEYAKRGYSVKQTLHAVTSGQLSKELKQLRTQHDQQLAAAHTQPQDPKEASFAERIEKPAGNHAMKILQQQASQPAAGITS